MKSWWWWWKVSLDDDDLWLLKGSIGWKTRCITTYSLIEKKISNTNLRPILLPTFFDGRSPLKTWYQTEFNSIRGALNGTFPFFFAKKLEKIFFRCTIVVIFFRSDYEYFRRLENKFLHSKAVSSVSSLYIRST